MSYLSPQEKNNLLADLIHLGKSDGNVSMPELTYLIWVAQKLGVHQDELMRLIKEGSSSYSHVSATQRVTHFYRILNMMFVDGKVEPEELESCKTLAYKMGLDRFKVDEIMAQIAENPTAEISLETLTQKFEGI